MFFINRRNIKKQKEQSEKDLIKFWDDRRKELENKGW